MLPGNEPSGRAAFQRLVGGVAGCIAAGVPRKGAIFHRDRHLEFVERHGGASPQLPGFPWPPLEDQVRGILAAFTGISYQDRFATEETTRDGAT